MYNLYLTNGYKLNITYKTLKNFAFKGLNFKPPSSVHTTHIFKTAIMIMDLYILPF